MGLTIEFPALSFWEPQFRVQARPWQSSENRAAECHSFRTIELVASMIMGPVCARFNCQEPGAASLQFDTPGSRVLLVDLTDTVAGIPVCAAHAKTRTAPMGWELVDLRSVVSQVEMLMNETPAPTATGVETRPSRRREDFGSPFTWDRQAREDVGADREPNVPQSPLLARAFRPR